ncbi:GDSL-type esterase/lipase family protein [Sphaerisporangium sp. TRM90804]|uniref:GDSL-type esterase/lipase family protein n=1 Tax=Sphaerisporangium sp. TRM90804 TaxID=3031113 RepID=UPI002447FE3C|nr:GDSL-type esterase/lipase family protein [Sphaerisporangium sp. TRM90804]MDH2424981.1 GDSL-type esterase/lipase family protein [Sphaerisporangium sp. TRM90804]
MQTRINIACSGARTINVVSAAAHGEPYLGEPPQMDQLAGFARRNTIKMVVLSIGGNDLGFGRVLGACVRLYMFHPLRDPCNQEQDPVIRQGVINTEPLIRLAIQQIRLTLTMAGYPADSYRIVVQSYPSPVTTAANNRYTQDNRGGRNVHGGCPMFDADFDWARNDVVPSIANMIRGAARAENVESLDLRDLMNGHEVCAKGVGHSSRFNSLTNPLDPALSEWSRFLVLMESQGTSQESMHPNYYGQLALGACLGKVAAADGTKKRHVCTNNGGQPGDVTVRSAYWRDDQ